MSETGNSAEGAASFEETPTIGANTGNGDHYVPRPKRIACILCRRRKLKCDGIRPSCGTCSRLGHDCAYDEVRKKSGPKRGYVKQLEARLAQVETLLKTQDSVEKDDDALDDVPNNASDSSKSIPIISTTQLPGPSPVEEPISNPLPEISPDANMMDPSLDFMQDQIFNMPTNDFSWEMISLGVEEPLPDPEVIDELHEVYFKRIAPSFPIIHRPRYYASLNLSPHMKPPICLRYTIWTHAASTMPKYQSVVEHFYHRARKYIQMDEMKGLGESMLTVAHCQTWVLLGAWEFKHMNFPRAWQSVGRSSRLGYMLGIHRIDGDGLDVKQVLPPPRDWIDREERRRTFWACFAHDRYASAGTGWPMSVDERDISTTLPSTDDAFEMGTPETTMFLQEAMSPRRQGTISSYAGVCIMAALYGRNLHHLHRHDPNDDNQDLNGPFWNRHRMLDNVLLNTSLSLPHALKLPQGLNDQNAVFCNMSLHTSTICLHQAAIFKAEKFQLPPHIGEDSKRRCMVAAEQITSVMKMCSHKDLSGMNPFTCFSLYIAARVFIQYLKSVPQDGQIRSSLQFLLAALNAMKLATPLAESFIMQLDVELEVEGLTDLRPMTAYDKPSTHPALSLMHLSDQVNCSPLFDIRESQNPSPRTSSYAGPAGNQRSSNAHVRSAQRMQEVFHENSIAGLQFSETRFDSLNVAQDMGTSPGSGLNTESHPVSEHPTPSTNSQKDSSNTSYSPSGPSGDNQNFGNSASFPLFQQGSTLTYNLAKDVDKAPHSCYGPNESWDLGTFDPTLAPKDTEVPNWVPDMSSTGFSAPFEQMGWNEWDTSRQGPQQ